MKPLQQVSQSYVALFEADKQLQQGEPEAAEASCRRAIEISRTIPHDEAFDYVGFDAIAHTTLAGALLLLQRYAEALESTEIALRYFNRRGELHQDEGKQWIDAVRYHAAALEGIQRLSESLKAYRTAAEMIIERKGEVLNKEGLQHNIAEAITRLEKALQRTEQQKPANYKAWWEFWS